MARGSTVEAFRLVHSSRMSRVEVVGRVKNAAIAMKKANTTLVDAVTNPQWSLKDIQDFAARARNLQAAVETIVAKQGD